MNNNTYVIGKENEVSDKCYLLRSEFPWEWLKRNASILYAVRFDYIDHDSLERIQDYVNNHLELELFESKILVPKPIVITHKPNYDYARLDIISDLYNDISIEINVIYELNKPSIRGVSRG